MSREVPQPTNQRYARIQKRRSESVRRGRGLRRCRTSSVGGGKDCLRSATALAASRQQRPTANSETLTSPASCRTSRRLMLLSVVNEKLSRLQFCALQRVPLALALQSCAVAATWQDGC